MTQWYVKDLSKLTSVSVQTLHHYDRINLLKPSLRLTNGYRLYSEKDLLKLQQIIALKFFGFALSQIKTLLAENVEILMHLLAQIRFLEEKSKTLLGLSQTLKNIISKLNSDQLIPWETIIKLIEVYRTTQKIKEPWFGTALTPKELKDYTDSETELKPKLTADDKIIFKNTYINLIEQIRSNPNNSPESDFGINIAKQFVEMINAVYGKEYATLRHSILEQSLKKNRKNSEYFFSPEIVEWLDKAIHAYYMERMYSLLNQVEMNSTNDLDLADKWNTLMNEMFGNSQCLKQEIIEVAQTDKCVGEISRKWLQQFLK